ncbi:phasin family protein [Roseospirillum parvum]|uniref:Phasin family protein n=1 Tax=Roseospirillum parvum TaxID=83401 RepID=A0A1G8D4X3_9PROT|nr:phasin family protein [Roseospirillum parvum]SDH52742.1 phasin family protein [Roseospirillum parvum]
MSDISAKPASPARNRRKPAAKAAATPNRQDTASQETATQETAAQHSAPQAKADTPPTVEVMEEVVEVSREQLESAVRSGREVVARGYQTAAGLGSEQTAVLTQVGDDAVKSYEDLVDQGRQTMEAWLRSGTILVKGWQDVGTMWLDLTRETLDDGANVSRRLAGCVDPAELAQQQQALVQESLSRATHQAGRIQLRSLDVLEDAMAPLRQQMDAAFRTTLKPLMF